jgi:hypothetical protein
MTNKRIVIVLDANRHAHALLQGWIIIMAIYENALNDITIHQVQNLTTTVTTLWDRKSLQWLLSALQIAFASGDSTLLNSASKHREFEKLPGTSNYI